MTPTTFTKTFTAFFVDSRGTVAQRIRSTVDQVLEFYPEGGWIDSHSVASAIGAHVTYIQHLLREAPRVCRYADQALYRAHSDRECSSKCQAHGTHRTSVPEIATYCDSCFLQLPTSGVCGNCE